MKKERNILTIGEHGNLTVPASMTDIWMTETELAELFVVLVPTIRAAIKAVYKSGVLKEYDTKRYVRQQNVTYERDIPILQQTPPKPEAAQEQSDAVRVQSVDMQHVPTEKPALKQREEQFIRDHLIVSRSPTQENRMSKSPKL